MENIYLTLALAPLISSIIVGIFGYYLGKTAAHSIAILGVFISTVLALYVFNYHVILDNASFNENIYTWLGIGDINFSIGFLIDNLTALMLVVVSFVSLMVHIYTIGYMAEDKGYIRFFSYISLFTFAMFMLVMANNFMQLFFGWEAVGLVSYLLIGFWFDKPSAVSANLKAFIVNRVGDFGFLLGIALLFSYFASLDYADVFASSVQINGQTMFFGFDVISVICLLLFVGAMAKSAQVPLHVWLPESMEGPTPISALIHAATMVTAGIFMVARMSPLFELSDTALTVVMVVGAIGALFMGLLGIVQNDIKRIIAYSTLSQLGYMTVALGVSAYSVAIFHLMTHAFFKALLFLGAGSVIMAMHHEQDIRAMGGLYKKMPITYATFIIGSLALIGFPGFAGFYSKDLIIEAVSFSSLPFASWVYVAVVLGVFVTALYTFRMLFLVFHTSPRMNKSTYTKIKESPLVVTIPLILLAIPSAVIGYYSVAGLLFGSTYTPAILADSITVLASHNAMASLAQHFSTALSLAIHSIQTITFWMMLSGVFCAWLLYVKKPNLAGIFKQKLAIIYYILINKYGFDKFNEIIFVQGSIKIGNILFKISDSKIIDNLIVNGSTTVIIKLSNIIRLTQTGYLYHYAFFMIISLLLILLWLLFFTADII